MAGKEMFQKLSIIVFVFEHPFDYSNMIEIRIKLQCFFILSAMLS